MPRLESASHPTAAAEDEFDFLGATGNMAAAIRAKDWGASVFGSPASWPQSLRSALSICLGSGFPIAIYWGERLGLVYNDEWSPILGSKHPWALGRPAEEVWPEIWDTIGPLFERVIGTGQATRSKDQLLAMHRHGFTEECYFDYTFSPIRGEGSKVGGIFNAVLETTFRVISERRTSLLRDLGEKLATASRVDEVCTSAMQALNLDRLDVPFSALYLVDAPESATLTRVACSAGCVFPASIGVNEVAPWFAAEALREGVPVHVTGLHAGSGADLAAGPWPEPCDEASVLPLFGVDKSRPAGVLVVGISPRLALDAEYQSFLDRIAATVGSAMARAQSVEAQRQRAEELARLDRAKTTFFSNVSHEFRTPLTLMMGPLADALEDDRMPAKWRERIRMAQRNAMRLSKLVNSLLEFTRIEAGRHQATYRPTDLVQLTADLASTFRSAMERAGLKFDVVCEPLPLQAFVDRDMWEKVVLNLLSNALKYTLRGQVRVTLRHEHAMAVLEVADTGVGVPRSEVPRLFERFHRVEGAQGRTQEGSGIGLALVQELVKLHGGAMAVESKLGTGTTFTVRVPLGSGHLPGDRLAPADVRSAAPRQSQPFVQEAFRWLPDGADALPESSSDAADPLLAHRYRATRGARIVVADDNADMRSYLHDLLVPLYEVECVADGEMALEAIRRKRPALVLSDVMMPRVDGFTLLAKVREDDRLQTLPVVLLSARAGEEARVEGLQAGADDYLVKPFTARELLARVSALIELDRVRRSGEEQLRLGLASARMFTWDLDLESGAFHASDNTPQILGRLPTRLRQAYRCVHREDRVRHRRLIRAAVDERHEVADEIRIVRSERREERWIEIRGRVIGDESGRPRQLSGVAFDITERKTMEAALRESDHRKDVFLAMLAHELRNPLAPIRNAGQLMLRLSPADGRLHHAVGIVNRQVQQLTRLVDDLLDVSRITQGRIELERQPVELLGVINAALEAAEDLLQAKGHRVTVTSESGTLTTIGDPARLQQCVVNLLANAAKYTDAGGEVQVELRRDGGHARLTITDNGAGIAPDLLPSVFDLFVQSERTLDRSQGGLGIGLSVVKRLVEMHGGSISARSPGIGGGSSFSITLALAEPAGAAQTPPVAAAAPRRRILIVDDNRDAAESLAVVLSFDGHDARTAFSSAEALELALVHEPELVLLDIGLPDIDGYELVRRMRSQPRLSAAIFVALTGYGQPEDRRRAGEAGFHEHLVNPASIDAIIRILGRIDTHA
jgi:PAS domain S-box-containing protein